MTGKETHRRGDKRGTGQNCLPRRVPVILQLLALILLGIYVHIIINLLHVSFVVCFFSILPSVSAPPGCDLISFVYCSASGPKTMPSTKWAFFSYLWDEDINSYQPQFFVRSMSSVVSLSSLATLEMNLGPARTLVTINPCSLPNPPLSESQERPGMLSSRFQ
jgi:hypothetical protein